ncbi:MAG TPA: DUF2782 domain-containing protein [Oleiagrimonas sp.]|nr:DUF2782 domain-containing protein [Oleiagrimonas sp.]
MKISACVLCVLGAVVLLPAQAMAQSAPAAALTALPPPSINAPGIEPVAPASVMSPESAPAAPAQASTAIPIPPLPTLYEGAPSDLRGDAPPTVKVVEHDGKRITQYYKGGQLYMVQVHPKYGVTYTYMVDKAHHLTGIPGAPPLNPVMYTILTWGDPDD